MKITLCDNFVTSTCCSVVEVMYPGDRLSGKPGNVRDFTENQGIVREKNLVREKLPKTVYCKLHICVHTGI